MPTIIQFLQFVAAAVIVLGRCPHSTDGFKILVFPMPAKSHAMSMALVAAELAKRGNDVTLLITKSMSLSLRELDESGVHVSRYEDTYPDQKALEYDGTIENMTLTTLEKKESYMKIMPRLRVLIEENCFHLTMRNDDLLDELEKERFDLVVVDGIFLMKCLYLIPHRLQVPWISYSDAVDPLKVRAPWLPSFVPHPMSAYTERMSFGQRLINTALLFLSSDKYFFPDPPEEVLQKFRKYGEFRDTGDLATRSLLWLLSKDHILDYAVPMMPNMVGIGGLTVKRTVGELPADYRKFIDAAERGVIVVSFGSMVSSFPREILQKFVSVFRRLDGYRVVWRLDNRDNVELPENVMIARWLPQNDIMAHSAVKLFITHCGNNGQYEVVYHAVPMIGFPLLGDQNHNAQRLELKGFGIAMSLFEFTADQLFDNINKVIADQSFKQRITKASQIFRSQPQSPLEKAAFWIEHVCQFGGDHLRSAGNELSLFSYFMLDVLAVVLAIVALLLYVTAKTIYIIVRKCCFPKHGKRKKAKTQ